MVQGRSSPLRPIGDVVSSALRGVRTRRRGWLKLVRHQRPPARAGFRRGTEVCHVSARAFAKAIQATDDPPLLVLLNSCKSASQIDDLVARVVPFAIGMADSIDDGDAINYAAQFYAAIANGQSINASHLSGQAALELAGLDGAELPTLAWAADVDPTATILVKPTDAA
jgi:hypothetical protein